MSTLEIIEKSSSDTLALWNGQLANLRDLMIPVEDRAYYFADAVYEVIRVYQGLPWLADAHYIRLARSLGQLQISYELSELPQIVLNNIAANHIKDGYVYIQISRGTASRNSTRSLGRVAPFWHQYYSRARNSLVASRYQDCQFAGKLHGQEQGRSFWRTGGDFL